MRTMLSAAAACISFVGLAAGAAPADAEQTTSKDSAHRSQRPAGLEEIIVTAQKREESLQDVPVPVTAITADSLVDGNQLRLQDYYAKIPGLSVAIGNTGAPVLTIRGVTTGGFAIPTVGTTIDDVPFGPTSLFAAGFAAPADLDPSDLARVEVLRGPQGTLYGASSIGGLLKYVTLDPSTEAVSGRVQASTSAVSHGDDLGYSIRGSVNMPLSDTFAIRASAFTRREPGYIDNVLTGEKDVDWTESVGGRISALWRLSDNFSIKASALLQDREGHGTSSEHRLPGLGKYQQSVLRDTGGYQQNVQSYALTLAAKIGRAELTSLTGYGTNEFHDRFDMTSVVGGLVAQQFGVNTTHQYDDIQTDKFTQELRLSMPVGERIEWLVGGFYTHEESAAPQGFQAVDPVNGSIIGDYLYGRMDNEFTETAAFTNLVVQLTERFDVQLGGRYSQIELDQQQLWAGPYVPALLGFVSPLLPPFVELDDSAFTYLVTPRFKVSPDLMVYARLASGYRPGGHSSNPTRNVLPIFKPDTTKNYEVGIKGNSFDGVLSYDASLYYIDWTDLHLQTIDPVSRVATYFNGSRAKSQGLELSLQLRPLDGMTVSVWGAWSDAKLTEPFPTGSVAYGAKGDRLPVSSRFSGSLTIDQDFQLTSTIDGSVGASVSYVGDREGIFRGLAAGVPLPRQSFDPYTQADVHAAVEYESWRVNLSVNNVTDERGVLRGGLGYTFPFGFYYIRPRTFELSIAKSF